MSKYLLTALMMMLVMSCGDDASTSSGAANAQGANSTDDPSPTSLTSPSSGSGGSRAAAAPGGSAAPSAAGASAGLDASAFAGNGAVGAAGAPVDPEDGGASAGGAGGAGGAGQGGGSAPAAIGAGSGATLAVKPNGEPCAANSECDSGSCLQSGDGQNRCFGAGGANDLCSGVFDCNGGLCLPDDLEGQTSVCVPDFGDCAQLTDDCQLTTVMICQFIQTCGDDVTSDVPAQYRTDFNYCVATECTGNALTSEECIDVQNFVLSGEAPCP